MANKIADYMEASGIKFIRNAVPVNFKKNGKAFFDGKVHVDWECSVGASTVEEYASGENNGES